MPKRQVIIIGLGPAGLSAAETLEGLGLEVLLLEEQSRPGGQFLRGPASAAAEAATGLKDRLKRQGQGLLASLRAGKMQLKCEAQILGVENGGLVWGLDRDGSIWEESAEFIILATGCRERFIPFPGWTLPGVISTGAAQIMLKTSGVLPGSPCLVGGAGPLPITYAGELIAAGGKLSGFWDLSSMADKLGMARHLFDQPGKIGQGLSHLARITFSSAAFLQGHKVLECRGDGVLREAVLARMDRMGHAISGTERIFPVDCLAMGCGFAPNLELAQLAGCELAFDPTAGGWAVRVDEDMFSSQEGVLAAGEITGIAGVAKSYIEGRMAALGAARKLSALPKGVYRGQHDRLLRKRQKELAFGGFINRLCKPPQGLLGEIPDETIICRCEEISLGQIREQVNNGFSSLDALKKTTCSTMGRCQGRTCGPILQDLLDMILAPQTAGRPEPLSVRSPVKPVPLSALADWAKE
jgi:NAD(P)H-nitrite reductase large subunit